MSKTTIVGVAGAVFGLGLAAFLSIAGSSTVTVIQPGGSSIGAAATTAAMTLYVATTGSDSASGAAGHPKKTINAALDVVPQVVNHVVTINVAAGTYPEQVRINKTFGRGPDGTTYQSLSRLTIQGATPTVWTPATGVSAGTLGARTGFSYAVAGAGWTVGDLVGKFAYIPHETTGFNGNLTNYLPITANTATSFESPVSQTGDDSGTAFTIVDLPTSIGAADFVDAAIVVVSNGSAQSANYGATNVVLRNLGAVQNAAGAAIILGGTAPVTISTSRMVQSSTFSGTGFALMTTSPFVELFNCLFLTTAYGGAVLSDMAGYIDARLVSVVALTGGESAKAFNLQNNSVLNGFDLLIRGTPADDAASAILSNGGAVVLWESDIRSHYRGVACGSHCDVSVYFGSTIATSGPAIWVSGYYSAGSGIILVDGSTLSSSGGDCINVAASGETVNLTDAAVVSNCAGFGVNLASSFGQVTVSSDTTMATNTGGDFATDGATPTSLTALRAVPTKTVVDAVTLNRLQAL
jgi:hypothetical protein